MRARSRLGGRRRIHNSRDLCLLDASIFPSLGGDGGLVAVVVVVVVGLVLGGSYRCEEDVFGGACALSLLGWNTCLIFFFFSSSGESLGSFFMRLVARMTLVLSHCSRSF